MEEDSAENVLEEKSGSSNSQEQCTDPQFQTCESAPNVPSDEPIVEAVKVNLAESFETEQLFESREHIIAWCQDVGKKTSSVIVILRSVLPSPGLKGRLYLGCERGGSFRIHKKKDTNQLEEIIVPKRKREMVLQEASTKKYNCPFELRGVTISDGRWKLEVHCGEHNHELGCTSAGHSFVGRLNKEEKQILIDLSQSGIKPSDVLATIKQRDEDNKSTIRTIYNARANLRLSKLDGKSQLQQLMKQLSAYHYVQWNRLDAETNEVNCLFWAHPESIQLAKCFPTVLIIDSTFKNNRFGMPLFEIVGVTSTNTTFTVAFVFVKVEEEDNYVWALSRLKTIFDPSFLPSVFVTDREMGLINGTMKVFPDANRLLCLWHMNKNVTKNIKPDFCLDNEFEEYFKEWTNITEAKTPAAYFSAWDYYKWKCESSWPTSCLEYIQNTWLPLKEHFVYAWTSKVKHFGNLTTIETESAHSDLKDYLRSSQDNFTTWWSAIHNMLGLQVTAAKVSFKRSLSSVLHSHQLEEFKELKGFVSHYALNLLVSERSRCDRVGIDASSCGCELRHTHGLPCAHEISQFSREGRPIPLSEVDSHWKKLTTLPYFEERSEADYLPELQLFKQRQESSEQARKQSCRKVEGNCWASNIVARTGCPNKPKMKTN